MLNTFQHSESSTTCSGIVVYNCHDATFLLFSNGPQGSLASLSNSCSPSCVTTLLFLSLYHLPHSFVLIFRAMKHVTNQPLVCDTDPLLTFFHTHFLYPLPKVITNTAPPLPFSKIPLVLFHPFGSLSLLSFSKSSDFCTPFPSLCNEQHI